MLPEWTYGSSSTTWSRRTGTPSTVRSSTPSPRATTGTSSAGSDGPTGRSAGSGRGGGSGAARTARRPGCWASWPTSPTGGWTRPRCARASAGSSRRSPRRPSPSSSTPTTARSSRSAGRSARSPGYAPDEVPTIGDWTERAYGDRREAVQDVIDRLYQADRRVDDGEFVVRTKDGDERVWAFSSAPLAPDADGRRLVISMAADVTARKQGEAALRRMSARLVQTGERERRRVARELHDELGGLLTSLQMSLTMNPAREDDAQAEIAESQELVRAMMDKVRDITLDLRPSLLDDLGLAPALDQLVERFSDRTRIDVDVPVRGGRRRPVPARGRDDGLPGRAGGADERGPARRRRPGPGPVPPGAGPAGAPRDRRGRRVRPWGRRRGRLGRALGHARAGGAGRRRRARSRRRRGPARA